MKLKSTLLAAAASLAIAPAANAYEGLYGAIGAGLNYINDEPDVSNDSVSGPPPFVFDSNADYDKGVAIYATLGYAWGNNIRTELEFSYGKNDIDQIDPAGATFTGWPAGSITGDTSAISIMANAIYDFEGVSDILTPYIGAGVGFVSLDHDIAGTQTPGQPTPTISIAYGGDNHTIGYQGIAGVGVDLAEGLILDLSYRFLGTRKKEVSGTLNGVATAFDVGHSAHRFMAGLRWNFGSSAPAVEYKDCWDGSSVPVTSECPPQLVETSDATADPINFTVYFDYDKSNLTAQAQTLIQEAASRALANDIETVVVQGNTDTSGGSAYNQALSERRASVVRDALIANGVPADRIRTDALGETNLAKPTADGVREPLNRRSDVTISFE